MDKSLATTRDFGVTFARLIAELGVDPHGYFEKKYTNLRASEYYFPGSMQGPWNKLVHGAA